MSSSMKGMPSLAGMMQEARAEWHAAVKDKRKLESALRRQQQQHEEAAEQAEKDYESKLEEVRHNYEEQKKLLHVERKRLLSLGQQISELRGRSTHMTGEFFTWEQDTRQKWEEEEEGLLAERRDLVRQSQQPLRLTSRRSDYGSDMLALEAAPSRGAAPGGASSARAAYNATGSNEWRELVLGINLDRRSDRLQSLLHLPWGLSVERLKAVDGRTLEWEKVLSDGSVHEDGVREGKWAEDAQCPTICRWAVRNSTRCVVQARSPTSPHLHSIRTHTQRRRSGSFSPHLTLSAVGCALSHRLAWQRLARQVRHMARLNGSSEGLACTAHCHANHAPLAAPYICLNHATCGKPFVSERQFLPAPLYLSGRLRLGARPGGRCLCHRSGL